MVFCVQASLAFTSAQRRNQALTQIQNRVAGKQRFGLDVLSATSARLGANALQVEYRFVAEADAVDLRTFAESTLTGQLLPLAGSFIRVHSCSHDEATNVCTVTYSRSW